MKYTMKQILAAESALAIDNPGACNAAGVSLALREAFLAWFEAEDKNTNPDENPAAMLIMNQLCHLMNAGDVGLQTYHDAKTACKRIAATRLTGGIDANA